MLGRKTCVGRIAGSAPISAAKVTKGQAWSAVEFHPLSARRPGMVQRIAYCHNLLNKIVFSCSGGSCRDPDERK